MEVKFEPLLVNPDDPFFKWAREMDITHQKFLDEIYFSLRVPKELLTSDTGNYYGTK